ncbi:MAG: ABC transporter permease [Planctomycetales bacterium]|nr:ABC transporter permease [bacterium]UNM09731.1 MAG: ABC transporter permease [Planctomycetales bacterium]
MKLPVGYSLRSMLNRPSRSLMTSGGVAIAIFLSVTMLALGKGLSRTASSTAEPLNLIVMSYGAVSQEFSAVEPAYIRAMASLESIGGGVELSPELYINTMAQAGGCPASAVLTRGLRSGNAGLHPKVSVAEGRLPERGNEVALGPLVATRLGMGSEELAIGSTLAFEGQDWQVVGILSAPGTAYESEIWAPLEDLMAAARRDDFSIVITRAADLATLEDVRFDLDTRTDIRTTVVSETEYFAKESERLKPVLAVCGIMTLLLVSGGMMAGMNTMFNSVMGRINELAVLLLLGYRRFEVVGGIMLEGLLLCLLGGVLGSAAGLLLSGVPMKFSMSAFRFVVDQQVLLQGIGLAAVIGVVGSIVPSLRLRTLSIAAGLRSAK